MNVTLGDSLYSLAAESVTAIDDRRATATFRFPDYLPTAQTTAQAMSMIVSGPANGTFVVPAAVTVRQDIAPATPAAYLDAWKRGALRADDLTANTAFTFPYRGLLSETIRNTYFHVSLWIAMMFLFIAAVVYAVKHLRTKARA